MRIDYDAINDAYQSELERSEREMLAHLRDAMRDGDVTNCTISMEWEICDSCRGNGHHSRHLGVIDRETLDDWDEEQWMWYKQGVYDHQCERCSGSGKVQVLDIDSLPDDVKQWITDYEEYAYRDAEMRRGERMMGA